MEPLAFGTPWLLRVGLTHVHRIGPLPILVLLPPNQLWFPLPAYILVCPVALTPESIVSDVNWSLRLNESL